ncbi:MAG: 5'-nucleotidase C-terminal domain-containing protein [Chitinophagaceae bacterium]
MRSAFLLLLTIFFFACNTRFFPARSNYENYKISENLPKDSSLTVLVSPYRDSMNKSMNKVIGIADETLEKKHPESTLGNFMADAMLWAGKKLFNNQVDAAFVNYGGIRITALPGGQVTNGKIFELMPFQNFVVLQNLKGDVLQQFLDLTAAEDGWPVAGIKMQIVNKKAVNVTINGEPLNINKTYRIVNSDYIATGGDNAAMLKTIPFQNTGYLMRDAIFDYIQELNKQGKNISAKIENRVTYDQ